MDKPDFESMARQLYTVIDIRDVRIARHAYVAGMEAAAKVCEQYFVIDSAADIIRTEAAKV